MITAYIYLHFYTDIEHNVVRLSSETTETVLPDSLQGSIVYWVVQRR